MKQAIGCGVVVLMLSAIGAASTLGEQTFGFLFKAGDVLWIGEDVGGAYEMSVLHQVVVGDEDTVGGRSTLRTFGDWSAVQSLRPLLEVEPALSLTEREGGLWGHDDLDWTVNAPDRNPALAEAFDRHVQDAGSDARSFYAARSTPDRLAPDVVGAGAAPLYFSDRGLFFNYRIASAYFFARSGVLLVFTHQPLKAVGLDTQHGFVLMRIEEKE